MKKKKMYLSIIVLSLLAASAFSGFRFGRKLGVPSLFNRRGSQLVTTSLVTMIGLLFILAFFEGLSNIPIIRPRWLSQSDYSVLNFMFFVHTCNQKRLFFSNRLKSFQNPTQLLYLFFSEKLMEVKRVMKNFLYSILKVINLLKVMKTLNLSLYCHLSGVKGKDQKGELTPIAKDVGVLHLMFALFLGLVGTAYLVLIHLELVVTSLEYILYNQLDHPLILLTLIQKQKLNPLFVTGFTDAEGCFMISIYRRSKVNTG